jgi:hypothetical protein
MLSLLYFRVGKKQDNVLFTDVFYNSLSSAITTRAAAKKYYVFHSRQLFRVLLHMSRAR